MGGENFKNQKKTPTKKKTKPQKGGRAKIEQRGRLSGKEMIGDSPPQGGGKHTNSKFPHQGGPFDQKTPKKKP